MNKDFAINSGDLRLWKSPSGKQVIVVVLFAEISNVTHTFTGWWWILGNADEGLKKYLASSHSLHKLIQSKK